MIGFQRWSDKAWSDTLDRCGRKEPLFLVNVDGDIEYWDWDVGSSSWRRLSHNYETKGYTESYVRHAISAAVAFGADQ